MKAYQQIIADLIVEITELELPNNGDTDADRATKRRIGRVLKKALIKPKAMSTRDL